MTTVVVTGRALADIVRLCDFLVESAPHAAQQTAGVLAAGLDILKTHPKVGRKVDGNMRELVISRGRSGYLALYEYDEGVDLVAVVAVRHQRESGYH